MRIIRVLAALALTVPSWANATLIYNTWDTNEGNSASYIVTVNQNGDAFDVEVTINPWDAEALGIFIDWGDFDLTSTGISGISPAGEVVVSGTDTTSNSCGGGCSIPNNLYASPDGEWEWVIRLGDTGYEGLQTFNFTLAGNGLTESDWGRIGMRAQVQCSGGDVLPGDQGNCDGSDKSWGFGTPDMKVSEPATVGLLGLGLLGMGLVRRRVRK